LRCGDDEDAANGEGGRRGTLTNSATHHEVTVFGRVRMPSLGVATEWVNSVPLGPAELRGDTVLVTGAEAYVFTFG
jgi:hypothetical protein